MSLTFLTSIIKSLSLNPNVFPILLDVLAVVVHILVIPVAIRADHGGQLILYLASGQVAARSQLGHSLQHVVPAQAGHDVITHQLGGQVTATSPSPWDTYFPTRSAPAA